ncbi:MAG: glycosyltransferase family protein [Candidatus Vogelbacteria bacterium]|nr:glycosyltransferase family protein [Candidatus Vogelbacteria bacterium]
MKIVAIVQARMGSTRLPGKMMMEILKKPIVGYVFDGLSRSSTITESWLATTTNKEDDVLAQWAELRAIRCFRGSSEDVLDRFYNVAKLGNANVVVRITADCPLVDPAVVDKIVSEFLSCGDCDYVSNTIEPTYPDGYDVEVFSVRALNKAWEDAKLSSEREHVTPYIKKHPEMFKSKNIRFTEDFSKYRCTLDNIEDFYLINKIIEECERKSIVCNLTNVLDFITRNPDWTAINDKFKRDEGYAKSLAEDRIVKR